VSRRVVVRRRRRRLGGFRGAGLRWLQRLQRPLVLGGLGMRGRRREQRGAGTSQDEGKLEWSHRSR
jgi:hypothetical protein